MTDHHIHPKSPCDDDPMERFAVADRRADGLITELAGHGFAARKSWPGSDGAPWLMLDLSEADKLLALLTAAGKRTGDEPHVSGDALGGA